MAKFSLNIAEQERVKLTQQQQENIVKIYQRASKAVGKRARTLPKTPSAPLKEWYLKELQKEINLQLRKAEKSLEYQIRDNMAQVSQTVVDEASSFNSKIGLKVEGAYFYVPDEIVKTLSTGKLYSGDWSLSNAIWNTHIKARQSINNVVAQGIAENKSAYDIAKDLEKYLNPEAKKDWDWSKVYPGSAKRIDYNAQRLARTMVSHAYQQSFVKVTQNNPFVQDYVWLAAGGNRTCEVCMERDGKHFPKDNLPLDHPNGMCTFEAYIPDSMTQIADRLSDWALGKEDPSLDRWYQSMGGVFPPVKKDSPVTPITSTPPPNNWLEIARGQDLKSLKKKGREDMSTLTSAEKKGIKDYTGKSYQKMNSYLRLRSQGYSEEGAKRISKIGSSQLSNLKEAQKGIDKLRTTEPLILRRGSSLGDVAGILPGDYNSNRNTLAKKTIQELNDMLTGSVGTYSSFISTTPDPDGGFYQDVDYIIYAPTGTRGTMVDSISQYATEDEFLVGPNTRFLIRGVEDSKGRMGSELRIFLELLPD